MRILRPRGDGFVSLTPGEAFFDAIFRGIFGLIRLLVLALALIVGWGARSAWRAICYAAYRYRTRGLDRSTTDDVVVPFRRP